MDETLFAIGMYLMYLYTRIKMSLYMVWMYLFENSLVVHWCRMLLYNVRSRISSCKIEPNYPYMCICSAEKELILPIEPAFQSHLAGTFNILANSLRGTNNEYLLLMKNDKTIISRIFRENTDDYTVDFAKTRRHFLSIEYTHPDMEDRIPIELDPAIYLIGNEILSARFVLRCLQYQSEKYVFDDRYVVKIMDSKIRMLTLVAGEYIVIGNTEYAKKSIKI